VTSNGMTNFHTNLSIDSKVIRGWTNTDTQHNCTINTGKGKGKDIPVTGHGGP
jgi:hypothetical protein